MRKLIVSLALSMGLSAYAGAKIEWDHIHHNFGAFNEDSGPVTAIFTLYNTGDEPLVITGARANCGCTTPTYSADMVQPGDSATLTVSYDPGGRPGRFEKFVFVDTNTEPKQSKLSIKGVSVGSSSTIQGRYPVSVGQLRLTHPAALLGSVIRGKVKSVFEAGYNASTDTLSPTVTDVPAWLNVKPYPERVPPGEQMSFSFLVTSDRVPFWDTVIDTVTVRPFPESTDLLRMPVIVTVTEDFSSLSDRQKADGPTVRFDKERLDSVVLGENGADVDLIIHNDGKNPLKLRRIYTSTKDVTINVRPDQAIKGGKSQAVRIHLPGDCLSDSKASAVILNVITNDPFNPRKTVTIPVTRQH